MRPELSVVIPAFNKRTALARALAGFAQQDLAAERFEVIIVDDGSTDGTAAGLTGCAANVIYLRQSNRGRAAARNTGVAAARAPVVLFCDADCIPAPGFVRAHRERHAGAADRVVTGKKFDVLAEWPKTPRLAAQAAALLPRLAAGAVYDLVAATPAGELVAFFQPAELQRDFAVVEQHLIGQAHHNWTPLYEAFSCDLRDFAVPWITFITQNVSVHRELLERAGPFDESFLGWGYEDSELGLRLQLHGARFLYEERAATYHQIHPGALAGVGAREYWVEFTRNYERLINKHPRLDVYLHWRFANGLLSARDYHELVVRHQRGSDPILGADYLRVCEQLARQLCRIERPSPGAFQAFGQAAPGDSRPPSWEPAWPLDT